ncbi:MAG: hypothetical protein LBQ00_02575 [Syntrophobacterales bacterium]|jgi:signal transduction histidine kinase|nr:hypothetical protein [Syntrophobacterales bacterium]
MEDKRTIVYQSLLFSILFLHIAITGYMQIRVTQTNIKDLLIGEGEILLKHVKREIDINLEYLELLGKSPALITPNIVNLMAYDEAIAEDIYTLIHSMPDSSPQQLRQIPFPNLLVTDYQGRIVFKKGSVTAPHAFKSRLLSGKEATVVRMPTSKENSLLMGFRIKDIIIFLALEESELKHFRQKSIVKDIVEKEEKSFNIVGTTIYDPAGTPYITVGQRKGRVFVLRKPLDSKFFPGATVEVLISREPAEDTLKKTAISFVVMLLLLAFSGAASTYAIFLLERKHAKKMKKIQKEMELKERLVSLGRVASGMAHEIRNPLNAISISAQRLKREFTPEKDKEEYYRFIDIMRGELLRVDRIVEDFLLSTRSHVPFVQENLHTIVEELIAMISEKARTQNIQLINGINPATTLECQKERLKQALYNLILNGIEAIRSNGKIELSADIKGKVIDLTIKDSGPGIKAEDLRSIFEYYYTTKDKGMGLGLPISYMIIKDHGGDIKAISEEGSGATFVVTLPLSHTPSGDSATPRREAMPEGIQK